MLLEGKIPEAATNLVTALADLEGVQGMRLSFAARSRPVGHARLWFADQWGAHATTTWMTMDCVMTEPLPMPQSMLHVRSQEGLRAGKLYTHDILGKQGAMFP